VADSPGTGHTRPPWPVGGDHRVEP
jgi:hypothetical protein